MINRRQLLLMTAGGVALVVASKWFGGPAVEAAAAFEIEKSDAEWRKILNYKRYYVLRDRGTERAGTWQKISC